MIAENIKYPYVKLLFDVVGILSFITLLFVFGINFYIESDPNGNFNAGITISGSNAIVCGILFWVTIISALASFLLKKIK
ncbi:MAG: hypothetical protein L0L09_01460 [Staphylococcus equorum]|uniref:hypothetical protein n=1 Tax=Staphylococcus TaxID=1279 RepID=UPI00085394D6|nr:hypothetical protein [Staphylococcus equorum]MDN6736168.1 hypothetical protein [Tetragenococcus koreensis]MDG0822536.1 hypothetical protein [Staphylococcus equorum]MDG0837281.1 hypothetical protein [Staphylococcus equorum]MDK9872702.1 hypothetical protein [Staphylococcus equorum]MDK9877276.1 hypothetical protein [Staphylococcus equorum]